MATSSILGTMLSLLILFTTLSRLPSLTSLSLVSLRIWGPLPSKGNRLSSLKVLKFSSNRLYGEVPREISSMTGFESIVLSGNSFNGKVPGFKRLSLTELELRNNKFSGSVPNGFASFDKLKKLDLSMNKLNGKIPPFLFSLPSVQYLDLSENRFSGTLPTKLSCGDRFVDISSNLLVRRLPSCMATNSSTRVGLHSWNCITSGDWRYQHRISYCSRDPLAAIVPPLKRKEGPKSKIGLILGIVGGIISGFGVSFVRVFGF